MTALAPITNEVPVKPRRRRHSLAFKQQVIAEMLAGQVSVSVSVIARRHDINANLLFKWKRLYLADGANTDQHFNLLPVEMADTPGDRMTDAMTPGRIEIVLSADRWITVHGEVSRDALHTVLEALTR